MPRLEPYDDLDSIIQPEPHRIVKRNGPHTSRLWSKKMCADGHKKLKPLGIRALIQIVEYPGHSQTEHDVKYLSIGRKLVKWFNELAKVDMVFGRSFRECLVTGAWVVTYYPTRTGLEFYNSISQEDRNEADEAAKLEFEKVLKKREELLNRTIEEDIEDLGEEPEYEYEG